MGKSPNEIKVLLGKSSINDGFSIAMFEPAGGEPYQRFAVFFWGVVLRGGILGGRNNVLSPVYNRFQTLWMVRLNIMFALPSRSGCYSLNVCM